MVTLHFPDPESAYKGINNTLIFNEGLIESHGLAMSNQTHLYDILCIMDSSYINPNFNFTRLANYRKAKWTSLVNNYVDRDQMEEVVSLVQYQELKKNKNYNIALHFANQHGGGKGCLLTTTFTRRYSNPNPIIIATVRASESMKRLLFDFLLLKRLGQFAWGMESSFSIQIFFPYIWAGVDWSATYLAYDYKARKKASLYKGDFFTKKVYSTYTRMKEIPIAEMEAFKYHALKRAWKVINRKTTDPPLLAKDCIL